MPALSLNHTSTNLGIPKRFKLIAERSSGLKASALASLAQLPPPLALEDRASPALRTLVAPAKAGAPGGEDRGAFQLTGSQPSLGARTAQSMTSEKQISLRNSARTRSWERVATA